MGTVQVVFEEEQPEATEVTYPEVTRSHVTGRGHVWKCVLRMLNRKLRTICPSGAFYTGSDKVTWPEDVLPGLNIFSHTSYPRTFFPYFFPVLFSSIFFSRTIFPYFFSYFFWYFFPFIFSPYLFFSYFFSRTFFHPYFFPRTIFAYFFKSRDFEIQRFKISVSCFF